MQLKLIFKNPLIRLTHILFSLLFKLSLLDYLK